jgi:hypothetical protein
MACPKQGASRNNGENMAKATFDKPITGIRGEIGGLVFRQMKNGTVIVSRAPDFSRRKPSKRQKNHWDGFREAAAAAKSAQSQPFYMELARAKGITPYNVALSDRMKPPVIHQIQRIDGRILI